MPIRPDLFTYTINILRYGQTAEELSEHVSNCVKAAQETGKQAELTIKLKFRPESNGSQIFIIDEIKPKLPQLARSATITFTTKDGNLQREDPRQTDAFSLKKVENDKPTEFKQPK